MVSWKTSILQHLRPQCHIIKNTTYRKYDTLLRNQMCHVKSIFVGSPYNTLEWKSVGFSLQVGFMCHA